MIATTTIVSNRSTSSRRQCRSFSTNVAVLRDAEDYEEDNSVSEHRHSSSRPRLIALRRQLSIDNKNNVRISDYATNAHRMNDDHTSSIKEHLGVRKKTAEEEQEQSLSELMNQIESLPLPKEPLIDTFGRKHSYLRVSLSERCNLRCLYCMPEDGVPLQPPENLLSNNEIMQLATWFNRHGVNKIRLTGGEPLLRKDLVDLVYKLNNKLPYPLEQIGMTTNGVTLSKYLPDLVDAGLTHVNISLDSLNADKFAKLTRRPPAYHDRVMAAIEDCARLLPNQTKINCVVMPDNVNELQSFCELSRNLPIDVRFIEYMPFNENNWQTNGFVSYKQMQDQIHGLEREEDGPNDTTKWWRLQSRNLRIRDDDNDDKREKRESLGRIGFITSMSEHFCGTCNRLRLTADGQLKVCLFGKTEVSLRDLLRQQGLSDTCTDDVLNKIIHHSVQRKNFKLGGHKDMEDLKAHSTENRPMTLIGG